MPRDGLKTGGPIDPTLIERFRADLAPLVGHPPSAVARLGVAVSGGSDSLALLLLAHGAFPGAIAAATVDHELRVEAAAEARRVGSICGDLGIPHAILGRAPGEDPSVRIANLQNRARTMRYFRLERWAFDQRLPNLAVAHHRDDVAETFLMRAVRGSGLRGLAAMSRHRPFQSRQGMLVRPLLGWSRVELAAIVTSAGYVPIHDPSNEDRQFDRVRVRQLLGATSALAPDRLARAAGHLRDAEQALAWAVSGESISRIDRRFDGERRLRHQGLPFEIKRRLVGEIVVELARGAGEVRQEGIVALIDRLDAGRGGTAADIQGTVVGDEWHFRPAPPRRSNDRSDESAATGTK